MIGILALFNVFGSKLASIMGRGAGVYACFANASSGTTVAGTGNSAGPSKMKQKANVGATRIVLLVRRFTLIAIVYIVSVLRALLRCGADERSDALSRASSQAYTTVTHTRTHMHTHRSRTSRTYS